MAVIRRRLPLAALIYLFAIGVYALLDWRGHPEHSAALVVRLVSHGLICGSGVLMVRLRLFASRARGCAAFFAAAVTLAGAVYNAAVGTPAERYAMYLVVLLTGMTVLFPWGWGCQATTAVASLLAYFGAAPYLVAPEGTAHGGLALIVASGTSVAGALFLERSRFAAFVQGARHRDEAEVTTALVRVNETLSAHLHEPDMVARVNGMARELLGSDVTATFMWDRREGAFVLSAAAGGDPGSDLRREPLACAHAALLGRERLEPGEPRDLAVATAGTLLGDLMRRWHLTAALAVAMARGDELVGVMLHGRRAATAAPDDRQRRLASGIAHAAAIALQNARLIADLQSANRLKSEFVSTMSHELRTPLNVILGFTEMARDTATSPPERDRFLSRVDAAGRDLLSLIEDTLEIGRMDAGRDDVVMTPVVFSRLWAQLGAAAARMPRTDGVALEWSEAERATSLLLDGRKLTVIVRNLVGNALKFTERGSVRVDATVADGMLVVRVADTGIGIRPEDQQLIFEMFRQADGSDSRRYGGVGLGLHIVRRTVEQLGGSLALESRRGHGSVFTVRLPAPRVPAQRAA